MGRQNIPNVLEDPVVLEVAKKLGKEPGQVSPGPQGSSSARSDPSTLTCMINGWCLVQSAKHLSQVPSYKRKCSILHAISCEVLLLLQLVSLDLLKCCHNCNIFSAPEPECLSSCRY